MEITPNLAIYYLLPMVELSKSSFGDAGSVSKSKSHIVNLDKTTNLVNVYLSTSDMIVVKVRDIDKVPDSSIINPYHFTDYQIEEDGVVYTIILYRVRANYLNELEKFRNGKFSRFDENTKIRISIFNNWDKQEGNPLYGALYRDPALREEVEREFNVKLSKEDEVRALPDKNNFIDLTLQHPVIQTIPNE